MKIDCACGEVVEIKKEEYQEPFNIPCPKCRRGYSVVIKLIPENDKFWE